MTDEKNTEQVDDKGRPYITVKDKIKELIKTFPSLDIKTKMVWTVRILLWVIIAIFILSGVIYNTIELIKN